MPVFAPELVTFREYYLPETTIFFLVAGSPVYAELGVAGDGVRVEWQIDMTRSSNADMATLRVFNLHPATRKALYEAWKLGATRETALNVAFLLGWDGDATTIFVGQIWKFLPEVHTGTDIVTHVEAGDGAITLRDAVNTLGSSFAKGTLGLVVQYLVSQVLRVPIDPVSLTLIQERAAALPVQSWDNYVVNGDAQDRLDELMDTLDLEWKIFRGQFIALQRGIRGVTDRPTAPVIAPNTGLMSWAEEEDEGVSLTALANPKVLPGVQVALLDQFGVAIGAPRHRVESVKFYGNLYGESLMDVVARKAVLT